MTRKSLTFLAGALAIAAFSFTAGAIAAQPHMVNALHALNNARTELTVANVNKGGHRERALDLVNQAIAQTNAGIAYAGN